MKVKYFPETDTLLVELSDHAITDTRDLNKNTLVEFDAVGNLVSMTIEHAKEQTDIKEFIFQPGAKPEYTLSHVAEESETYSVKKDAQ
jgi:uncharacterized protein YuzE